MTLDSQPPACGKISEELASLLERAQEITFEGCGYCLVSPEDRDVIVSTLRLHHPPAPVADERAEVDRKCEACGGEGSLQNDTSQKREVMGEDWSSCDDCNGTGLSAQPSGALERATAGDYEAVLADHRRLVRELDVLLHGEGAAKQASLCDIVAQVAAQKRAERAPGGDAWLAIETAPKDGTWILLRGRNSADRPMIPVVAAWHPPGAMGRFGWVDSGTFKNVNELAVDWLPLPDYYAAPPQSETASAPLRAALEKYGRHIDVCGMRYSSAAGEWLGNDAPCSCGFDAALSNNEGTGK